MSRSYAALVVTFRRPASLGRVLESLAVQSVSPSLVVVRDNCPEGSAASVVREWSSCTSFPVIYDHDAENLGPAGGWAAAASLAEVNPRRGSWALIVDDDDPLGAPELLAELLDLAERASRNDRCGAVGLRGAHLIRWRARLRRATPAEGELESVDYLASGGAPLYLWDAIDEVGLFRSDLFFGFEDLDQGLRMTRAGWRLLCTALPGLFVPSETSPRRVDWREYYKTRAFVFTMNKHVGLGAAAAFTMRSVILGSLLLVARTGNWKIGWARCLGATDAFRGSLGARRYQPEHNEPKQKHFF